MDWFEGGEEVSVGERFGSEDWAWGLVINVFWSYEGCSDEVFV